MKQEHFGQVDVDPVRFSHMQFDIGDESISAVLLPGISTEDYTAGVKETISENGDRKRIYLKLPKKVREAGHTVVEYYHDHDKLAKGIGAVGVAAGIVTVGTLVAHRLKKPKS